MMERIAETSPRFKARMAGVCQLMEAPSPPLHGMTPEQARDRSRQRS